MVSPHVRTLWGILSSTRNMCHQTIGITSPILWRFFFAQDSHYYAVTTCLLCIWPLNPSSDPGFSLTVGIFWHLYPCLCKWPQKSDWTSFPPSCHLDTLPSTCIYQARGWYFSPKFGDHTRLTSSGTLLTSGGTIPYIGAPIFPCIHFYCPYWRNSCYHSYWWVPYFEGQSLDTYPNYGRYRHLCGPFIDVYTDKNPYKGIPISIVYKDVCISFF